MSGDHPPWRQQAGERFVLLTTRFDARAFLASWSRWRDDPQRCAQLYVIAIDRAPPSRDELAALACDPSLHDLRRSLLEAWPPLTPDLHTLAFEAGRVQLQLAVGPCARWLPELVVQVDAFDVAACRADEATVDYRALARLAVPGASLTVAGPDDAARRALAACGFEIESAGGAELRARYAPFHLAARRARVPATAASERHCLVVGAGLAGCATAWALAERGWRSTVFDAQPVPAGGASGNPAGLIHAVVHAHDGVHARLLRVAALQSQAEVAIARREYGVAGGMGGLLRSETRRDLAGMRALLGRLALPADLVRAVDAGEAEALCGLPRPGPAWFYPGGGWVDPAGLARSYLARAGSACRFIGGLRIERLQREGAHWQVRDAHDRVVDAAATVVLANAGDAARLAGIEAWPIEAWRGQLSWADFQEGAARATWPRVAIAAPGHALRMDDGRLVFGATRQRHDPDPAVRTADHVANLEQLERLVGRPLPLRADGLTGRTAWRWTTQDRLPLIGAVPDPRADGATALQRWPREPGLFTFCALGSRGIAWSALGGRVLAAAIAGGPAPLPAGLLKALDPARFAQRALRGGGTAVAPRRNAKTS